jgi:hypothetical protein
MMYRRLLWANRLSAQERHATFHHGSAHSAKWLNSNLGNIFDFSAVTS